MATVAVVAHRRKQLGEDGLVALRDRLAAHGVDEPLWYEVAKSRKAPEQVRRALDAGADLVLVWGGDGTVQRCADAMATAGTTATLAILPAGTANVLAANLGIPEDLDAAVDLALHAPRRAIDLGTLNGEHFALMAGTGVTGEAIRLADDHLKERFGRFSYLVAGRRAMRDAEPVETHVRVDGVTAFEGLTTAVLLSNVGRSIAGIETFTGASIDDGRLHVGIVTADRAMEWARVLAGVLARRAERSPLVQRFSGAAVEIRARRPLSYELDGGHRGEGDRFVATIEPGVLTVAAPSPLS